MLRRLFSTDSGMAGLLLRLTLAVVMFPHGAQKALGWFGGQGFTPTLAFFTRAGIPPVLALVAGLSTCANLLIIKEIFTHSQLRCHCHFSDELLRPFKSARCFKRQDSDIRAQKPKKCPIFPMYIQINNLAHVERAGHDRLTTTEIYLNL